MQKIRIYISDDIIKDYPEVAIGYLHVENLNAVATKSLPDHISTLPGKAIEAHGLSLQSLVHHPTIQAWREVYQQCGVKPKTYKPSVEALLRRFLREDYKAIHNAVDLYNYISAGYILPMGGYNLKNIEQELGLRYGYEGEQFIPLSGEGITPTSEHIVYADQKDIICWMWNHQDCKRTMLHPDTASSLFIVDSLSIEERPTVELALVTLSECLVSLGASPIKSGILTDEDRQAYAELLH